MTRLIDTHQHLVYPDVAGYGWTDGIPMLANRAFTLEQYQDISKGTDIVGTLFMETGVDDADFMEETRYVAECAKDPANGIVGIIASCRPETDAGFTDWLDECDGLGVVGYRRILHVMDDELSRTDTFRRNLRILGARGKPFDLCMLPKQLGKGLGLELAQACQNTTIVLNHCGVPDIASGGLDPWRADLKALATMPNIVCKLSGLLAYCAAGDATYAAISPYVDHVLDVFGPSRMVWGSDWPVVELANGLPDWLSVTEAILAQLSTDESTEIGCGNTSRIFGLDKAQ